MRELKRIEYLSAEGKRVLLYEPQEKQKLFHLSEAEETLFGGAAGGGKSEAIMWDAYDNAYNLPRGNFLVLRRNRKDLYESLVMRTKIRWPECFGSFNENKHLWTIHSKTGEDSYIWFSHINTIDDLKSYQSLEYDGIYFDELTHFEEDMYVYMKTRLRTTKEGFKPFVKSATNPGSLGHEWVKRRFEIDNKDIHYKIWRPEPELNKLTGSFIQSGSRIS